MCHDELWFSKVQCCFCVNFSFSFFSLCTQWELVVWGDSSQANKWQNWQSQSRIRPPDTVQYRLQREPCDTSPKLFSVNSALSRLSILPCRLMSQQTLPSQPPTLPPSSHWHLPWVYCVLEIHLFIFILFVCSREVNRCLFYKTYITPSNYSCHFVKCVWKRDEQLYCSFFLILSWRLSTYQMLTDHFPFHSDSFFIAHSTTSSNEDGATATWWVSCFSRWLSGHFIIRLLWSRVDWWTLKAFDLLARIPITDNKK